MRCRPLWRAVLHRQAVREQHGHATKGSLQAPLTSAVVFAESTQDVADAVIDWPASTKCR